MSSGYPHASSRDPDGPCATMVSRWRCNSEQASGWVSGLWGFHHPSGNLPIQRCRQLFNRPAGCATSVFLVASGAASRRAAER
jgi:hypothetical protein